MRCRSLIARTLIASSTLALSNCGGPTPDFQQVVQMPREQLYAELERKFARVEAAAAANPISTGHPPYPVQFSFERDAGKRLAIDWRAGFREETFEYWLEDGPTAGETVLNARISLYTLRDRVKESNLLSATEDMLDQADMELEGHSKAHALLGGSSSDD